MIEDHRINFTSTPLALNLILDTFRAVFYCGTPICNAVCGAQWFRRFFNRFSRIVIDCLVRLF